MIARLANALRRTGRIVVERPRAALWTTLALTAALLAVGIAGIAALGVDRYQETAAPANAGLVVYLGDGVTDARAQELVGQLHGVPGIEHVELIPPAESAKRLVRSLGSGANLLEGVDVEALPASVEITLSPGMRDVVAMSPIVRELRGTTGVADVVVEEVPEDTSAAQPGVRGMRAIAWVVAALFAGLALITALSSIRVRLDASSQEYRIVELLGGGPSFLAIPTALAGALQGLFAALIAGGLLVLGLHLYGDSSPVPLELPGALIALTFVGGGAAIGLVGGGLAGLSRTRVA